MKPELVPKPQRLAAVPKEPPPVDVLVEACGIAAGKVPTAPTRAHVLCLGLQCDVLLDELRESRELLAAAIRLLDTAGILDAIATQEAAGETRWVN